MRRGALELSLNALVMFIVSVIVLGFGIHLVGVFVDTGFEVIAAPDHCGADLDRSMRGAERFDLCPSSIPSSAFAPNAAFTIHYSFFNVADEASSAYGVGTTSDEFEIQPNAVQGLGPKDAGRSVLLIRLKDDRDAETLSDTEHVRLYVCPLSDPADPTGGLNCAANTNVYGTDDDPLISRVLTINVR